MSIDNIILVVIFVLFIIYGIYKSIDQQRHLGKRSKTVYYATEDVLHKELCPRCNCKMKKTWIKEEYNPLGADVSVIRELVAKPVYTCSKCGYSVSTNEHVTSIEDESNMEN